MGRYYSGDINGKFMFGVQRSDDADFFGVEGRQGHLEYYFTEDDLEGVEEGIAECLRQLGDDKKKIDDFFSKNNGWNEEMINKETGIALDRVMGVMEWYARLELGEKIRDCIKENGQCWFDAEL